jgi:3-oxoadipate enol-lactonase
MAATESREATEVGGRRLSWRRLGEGPALLLVNGYAATASDWDLALLGGLAESFELICPDNRGVGESELGDPAELTIDSMAGDVEAILDAAGLERAPVVGWSMGGYVAQRLTARAPERVSALALLSTDPGGPTAVPGRPEDWAALLDHSGTPREQASRLIALLFPPDLAPKIDRLFGDVVAAARAGMDPATLAAQEAAMATWHARDSLDPVPTPAPPVLVLHGDADAVIPVANADVLAARWPGARVERFAGGGHAFMAQFPGEIVARLLSFLGG